MTDWDDMDFEERSRTLYEAARGDLLAKQIANYTNTRPGVICAFARANGLPIRTRVPGLHKVKSRKRLKQFSPLSTPSPDSSVNSRLQGGGSLEHQGEADHART